MMRTVNGVTFRSLRRYKYQTTKPYSVALPVSPEWTIRTQYIVLHAGTLTIHAGYAWDGASGGIDTDTFLRPSLVHDALYQLLRLGLLPQSARALVDQILRAQCIEDGMCRLRAWYVYRMVRLRGGKSAAVQDRDDL